MEHPVTENSKKRCPACGVRKRLTLFSKNVQTSDGLATYCKPCHCAKQREWKQANPDKVRKWKAAWVKKQKAAKSPAGK